MKEIINGKNAASMTQEDKREYVESVAKLVYEMLVNIGNPEYAQKIYSIVYSEHNSR